MEFTNVKKKLSATSQTYPGADRIWKVELQNGNIKVELTNIGAAITAIHTPDRNKTLKNIVAGFPDLKDYLINKDYFGAVVGRYANRIAGGQFSINGKMYHLSVNNGSNHLHGGTEGFSHKRWTLEALKEEEQQCSVSFGYCSPDGEEGYPGNLHLIVEYVLDHEDRLHIHYSATTDQSTPVNLTNHSYFNLTGFESQTILDHILSLNAGAYTEKNEHNTPTGKILPVANTDLDFRICRKIGDGIGSFPGDMGYDHNFVLDHAAGGKMIRAALLAEHSTGRQLAVYTDQPGIQLYTANFWNGTVEGQQGVVYDQHGGVALETQAFPDSVHHSNFPSTILHPGEKYYSTTIFEFGISAE